MELRRPDRRQEALAKALGSLPDVTPVAAQSGQVLLYPHHVPNGLYLVLQGVVRKDSNRLMDASRGPFLIPSYDELDRPAPTSFTVARETRMLFIPRSLALFDAEVRRLLESAGLAGRPTA
jgi:hypothetical protein